LFAAVELCALLFERCLRGGKTRGKQTERRAGNVVEVDLVAELD
jgi:hypothetical protein